MPKQNKLSPGDHVSHKGNKWTVIEEFGGLVRIKRDCETAVVRRNQVREIQC